MVEDVSRQDGGARMKLLVDGWNLSLAWLNKGHPPCGGEYFSLGMFHAGDRCQLVAGISCWSAGVGMDPLFGGADLLLNRCQREIMTV